MVQRFAQKPLPPAGAFVLSAPSPGGDRAQPFLHFSSVRFRGPGKAARGTQRPGLRSDFGSAVAAYRSRVFLPFPRRCRRPVQLPLCIQRVAGRPVDFSTWTVQLQSSKACTSSFRFASSKAPNFELWLPIRFPKRWLWDLEILSARCPALGLREFWAGLWDLEKNGADPS